MYENLDIRVDGRYRLLSKLGRGTFGVVYEAIDLETDRKVAIKLEPLTIDDRCLDTEIMAFQELSGRIGIPGFYADGEDGEYHYMVTELLGPSLADLLSFCGGTFSLKTVLMIADQLIRSLEHIHRQYIVHRDIKPHNFLMGLGRCGNRIYVIDFGVIHKPGPRPFDLHSRKPFTIGTNPYASVSAHLNFGRCRSDDLESLGYVLLHFLRGDLPWGDTKGENEDETARLLLEQKKSISIADLCAGLPEAFAKYFDHIRSQQNAADDNPNYSYLRKLFQRQFLREGFKHDNVYDWTIRKFLQTEAAAANNTTATMMTIPSFPKHSSITPAKQSSSEAQQRPNKTKSLRRRKENPHKSERKAPRSQSKRQTTTKSRQRSRAKKRK